MPLKPCKSKGKRGWQWGSQKCYVGVSGKARARRQMRAILATGWSENAEGCGAGEPGNPGFQEGNTCGRDGGMGAATDDPETWDKFDSSSRKIHDLYHVTSTSDNLESIKKHGLVSGHESKIAQSSLSEPVPTSRVFVTTSREQADVLYRQFADEGSRPAMFHLRLPSSVLAKMDPRTDPGVEQSLALLPDKNLVKHGLLSIKSEDVDKVPKAWRERVVINAAPKRRPNPLRADPTRTASIRRRFTKGIRGRYRRIVAAIRRALLEHNVLQLTENASDCGAGEEGSPGFQPGNTCGGPSVSPSTIKAHERLHDLPRVKGDMGVDRVKLDGVLPFKKAPYKNQEVVDAIKKKGAPIDVVDASSLIATQPFVDEEGVTYFINNPGATLVEGPNSAGIPQDFPVVVRKNGNLYVHDGHNREVALILKGKKRSTVRMVDLDDTSVENAPRFVFRTTPERLAAFLRWVQQMIEAELIDATDPYERDAYWRAYVEEGFRQGQGRAWDDVHKVMLRERVAPWYEGSREEFLRTAFGQPVAVDRVKMLAGRVFTDLQGISQWTATQMNRSLSDSMAQGEGAVDAMRRLVDTAKLSEERALLVARTEIIRAHAEGQLTAMEDMGVTDLGVAVEWDTAHDDRVCPKCADLQGIVVKTSEAHGMIPRHPNCRCSWIPANVGESEKGQERSQSGIEGAIADSVGGEKTTWVGADANIDRDRPESALNVFCPTGEGGGIDPTCTKEEVGHPKIPEYVDKFGEKPGDNSHAQFRHEMYQQQRATIERYFGGEKPVAEYEQGDYRVLIMRDSKYLIVKKGDSRPAPSGGWMGFWDPDLKEVVGLSKKEYGYLPTLGQMKADVRVQAIKYAASQFEDLKKRFWGEGTQTTNVVVNSDCGAGAEGDPGFQPGNTCGRDGEKVGGHAVTAADQTGYTHVTKSEHVGSILKTGLRVSDGIYGKAVYLGVGKSVNTTRQFADRLLSVKLKKGTRQVEVKGFSGFRKLSEALDPSGEKEPHEVFREYGVDAVRVAKEDGGYLVVFNPDSIERVYEERD